MVSGLHNHVGKDPVAAHGAGQEPYGCRVDHPPRLRLRPSRMARTIGALNRMGRSLVLFIPAPFLRAGVAAPFGRWRGLAASSDPLGIPERADRLAHHGAATAESRNVSWYLVVDLLGLRVVAGDWLALDGLPPPIPLRCRRGDERNPVGWSGSRRLVDATGGQVLSRVVAWMRLSGGHFASSLAGLFGHDQRFGAGGLEGAARAARFPRSIVRELAGLLALMPILSQSSTSLSGIPSRTHPHPQRQTPRSGNGKDLSKRGESSF